MLIDYDISTDADVSSILDQFLIDNTSSDIVVEFLSKYEDDLAKVWRYSDCYEKMFQFDYWKSSSSSAKKWIAEHLKKIPVSSAAILCWQICFKSSPCMTSEKKSYKNAFDWILGKTEVSHPYSKSCEAFIRPFDEWIFSQMSAGITFPECMANMPNDVFMRYSPWIYSSLFSSRIYQFDVFEAVDEIRKWYMLKYMYMLNFAVETRFCSQIYSSGLSDEIKIECFKIQRKDCSNEFHYLKNLLFKDYPDVFTLLKSTTSFDVIQVELAMRGCEYCLKNILMYYILRSDIKMLIKWWNNCREEVKEVYDLGFIEKFDKFSDVSKRISLT